MTLQYETPPPEVLNPPASPRASAAEWVMMGVASIGMLVATALHWWPLGWMDVIGFVTGGVCVWLTVREDIWNWPIGLANNVAFLVLFWHTRLFADASLQVVYFVLGVYGWLNWLYGGNRRTELRISRTLGWEWLALAAFIPAGTLGLREILIRVNGAAPFWDSVTTILSLAAQYLLCRKRIENWLIWMIADVIYIPLYFSRALPLTGILYGVFLLMCVAGWVQWAKRLRLIATRPEAAS